MSKEGTTLRSGERSSVGVDVSPPRAGYPLPRDLDARTRTEKLTLAELRRAIPKDCMVPSDLRSFATLSRVVATVALLAYLQSRVHPATLLQWTWLVMLTVAQGFALVGLFVLGHDCGHSSFSKRRWVNRAVGHICMSPLLTSLKSWQLQHDHHHRWPQKHGVQLDVYRHLMTRTELAQLPRRPSTLVGRLGYAIPGGFLLWILAGIYRRATLRRSMPELVRTAGAAGRVRVSAATTWAVASMIWAALWVVAGPVGILKYHLAPLLVATLTGSLLIAVQHTNMDALFYTPAAWTPLRGQIVSTFDVRFPRLLEWMWCDINFHIPHHVAPGIPWYHLRRASRALARELSGSYQERRFGMSELRFLWRVPFLRLVPELGYFAMDSQLARRPLPGPEAE